jgi:hypothetical protein
MDLGEDLGGNRVIKKKMLTNGRAITITNSKLSLKLPRGSAILAKIHNGGSAKIQNNKLGLNRAY